MKGLIALCILIGVVAMVCWLVGSRIFSAFGTLKESSLYQGGLYVNIGLPVILVGFVGFIGLVFWVKSRD